jgi:hypothetical protein
MMHLVITLILVNKKNVSDKNQTNLINSGLPTLLFIVFLILKLTGNIDWSWWWVTSPLWIPVAAAFTLIIIALVFYNTGKQK